MAAGLNIGSTAVTAVYVGTTTAQAVYLGTSQVWPTATTPTYNATGAGKTDILDSGTFSCTATAGSYVLLWIAQDRSDALSTVKYGSTNMSLLQSLNNNNSAGNGNLNVYGLSGVPGGAQTVTVTGSVAWITAQAVAYQGVNSVVVSGTVFGSGTSLSQSVSAASATIIVQGFSTVAPVFSSVSGGTNRYKASGSNSPALSISDSSSASTSFTASHSASNPWSGIAIALSG